MDRVFGQVGIAQEGYARVAFGCQVTGSHAPAFDIINFNRAEAALGIFDQHGFEPVLHQVVGLGFIYFQGHDDQPVQAARERQGGEVAVHLFFGVDREDQLFVIGIGQGRSNPAQALDK